MHALGLALGVLSALRVPGPLSPRNASYDIHARFDPKQHTVEGHERLTWRNVTSEPVKSMVFHLYMNAFKNEASTFYRESKGQLRRTKADKHGWGAIDVSKIVVGGVDVTKAWKVDDTLATVELPTPVDGGAIVTVDIEWKTLLPKVFARAGYHEDFYAIAQWFPKIGVWDCSGSEGCRWRAHQHHGNSEFFADYGVYDVELDAPKEYVLGATGVPVSDEKKGDRTISRFHAEDVHDFVIAACPRFKVYEDSFSDSLGQIKLRLLDMPGHEANVPRHLAAAKAGLADFEKRLGPYPYSQLTIVDVIEGGEGAGGMEYPTLFFTDEAPVPGGVHLPEYVTIHELGHQFFQGIVGSDEVEEAWLDEGFTETLTDFGLSHEFGRKDAVYDIAGHRLSLAEMQRLGYRQVATVSPLETRAFDYPSFGVYGSITYGKTDVVLRTLEGLVGDEKFGRGWQHYFNEWKFRHPRMNDFVASFDDGAGEDLRWFWNQALSSTAVLDYEVMSIETRRKRTDAGLFDVDGGTRKDIEPEEKLSKLPWESEVVVHRKGDFTFPVELKVVFSDGSEKRERWDGGQSGPGWKRFVYDGEHEVVWAQVDPDDKIPLDVRRFNNGLRAEDDGTPRKRIVSGFQSLVSTVLAWVGF